MGQASRQGGGLDVFTSRKKLPEILSPGRPSRLRAFVIQHLLDARVKYSRYCAVLSTRLYTA